MMLNYIKLCANIVNKSRLSAVLLSSVLCLQASAAILSKGENAYIVGTITQRDACEIAVHLDRHPDAKVVIDSLGGDAWGGTTLARMISLSGATAVVLPGGHAVSAAAVALLGAHHKDVNGYVLFHAPSTAQGNERNSFIQVVAPISGNTVYDAPDPVRVLGKLLYPVTQREVEREVDSELRTTLLDNGMAPQLVDHVMASHGSNYVALDSDALDDMRPAQSVDRAKLHFIATRVCESVSRVLSGVPSEEASQDAPAYIQHNHPAAPASKPLQAWPESDKIASADTPKKHL